MLSRETIALSVTAKNWEEAVRAAGELLVKAGAAEPRYIEGMLRTVHELGPYIVIAPGVAIPHARPEDGALKPAFAVITLEHPIAFGNPDNDPVQLVIAFCAPDSSSHLGTLSQVAQALGQPDFVSRVISARTPEEVLQCFQSTPPRENLDH